jgi:hypothetical protein
MHWEGDSYLEGVEEGKERKRRSRLAVEFRKVESKRAGCGEGRGEKVRSGGQAAVCPGGITVERCLACEAVVSKEIT